MRGGAAANGKLQKTRKKACDILFSNSDKVWRNGSAVRRTVPSRENYTHQWLWDSATCAMGLIHVDPQRAYDEVYSVLSGQWKNGFLPHIIFDPKSTGYFPGPKVWKTEKYSPKGVLTSGITQPPLVGFSLWYLYQNAPNKKGVIEFLKSVLPQVKKYHDFLKTYRDSEDSGLLTIVHPWEGGCDNSPLWDSPLTQIELDDVLDRLKKLVDSKRSDLKIGNHNHRPQSADYHRYIYLVDLFKKTAWNQEKMVKISPFAVKDVLFNSIWCMSNEALANCFRMLNQPKEAKKYEGLAKQTRKALMGLWSKKEKLFLDVDVSHGRNKPILENTIGTFAPLLAKAVTLDQLPSLITRLTDPTQYWTDSPAPTTAVNSPKFDKERYWRGPTWPITNFFLIYGLQNYIKYPYVKKVHDTLLKKTLTMIADRGFSEYFSPFKTNGAGNSGRLGFGNFSWTAAIFIALYEK